MNANDIQSSGFMISERSLDVEKLKIIEQKFDEFDFKNKFVFDPFLTEPEMGEIFFNEGLITRLKSILGERFILLADTSLHYGRRNVMHTDNTSLLAEGINLFEDNSEFKFVTIGTYFQASKNGDGLRVVPGSHLKNDRFTKYRYPTFRNKVLNTARKILPESIYKYLHPNNFAGINVENEYGDSVIFDIRIEHRSQYRPFPLDLIPNSSIRKAIFHRACSYDLELAQRYQNYLSNKVGYNYLKSERRVMPKQIQDLADKYEITVL